MESPPALTTLLYLLMRDHLPTGKVRDLIEESLASSEGTVYTSKELEQLARRYGADLLAELELPPAAPAPSTPAPEMRPHSLPQKQASYFKALQALIEKDGWASVTEIVATSGLAVSTVRNNLRRAVGEGDAEAKGQTISRRYKATLEGKVSLEQSSVGEHDAPGEGAKPADPADDTGEQGDGEDSTHSQAPAEEPPKRAAPRGRAVQPGETDVELMARVSDYINESTDPVYPTELETIFRVTRDRRAKIVKMLIERGRIRLEGAGPSTHYLPRVSAEDYSPLSGEEPEGSTTAMNLRTPEKVKPPPRPSEEIIDRFKRWATGQRTFKRRHAIDAFPKLDFEMVGRLCTVLAAEGFLEARGEGGESHFAVKSQEAPTDSLGRRLEGEDTGTLEGRVMAELGDGGRTLAQLTSHLGAPEDDIKRVLAKLIQESMATPGRSNGSVQYAAL